MSPFTIYFCKRLNISHAIKPCPVCMCLASQKRNSLIQGREAMRNNGGMRSRKGQGREGEVNFEKMNEANTCSIMLNVSFMFLAIFFENSGLLLKVGRLFLAMWQRYKSGVQGGLQTFCWEDDGILF